MTLLLVNPIKRLKISCVEMASAVFNRPYNGRDIKIFNNTFLRPTTSIKLITSNIHKELMSGKSKLESIFPELLNDLVTKEPWCRNEKFVQKLTDIMQYNVLVNLNAVHIAFASAYQKFEKPENLTDEKIKLAAIFVWCWRMIEESIFLSDDIIDDSEIRYDKPCWFRREDVGLTAITDSFVVEQASFYLMNKYLSSHPHYGRISEIMHDEVFQIVLGQCFDVMKFHINEITMENFNILCWGKCAAYCRPISVIMYLANINDEIIHDLVKNVLVELELLLQVQSDYADGFSDLEITGKTCTDIKNGRLSWLAVVALEKANTLQREIMEAHYGRKEQKSIQAVRNLYEELGLQEVYKTWTEQAYERINRKISQLPKSLPHDFFFALLRNQNCYNYYKNKPWSIH